MEVLALIVSITGIMLTQQLRKQREEQELLEIQNFERTIGMKDKRKTSHMNAKLQSLGRENNCITTCCFPSINDARNYCGRPKLSSKVICLNGQWKFKLFSNVSSGFHYIEDHHIENINTQQDITVPGCWQLQVLGDSPIYTNIKYIIPVDPPSIPSDENPTGYYKHTFTLTSEQIENNNNIYLSFGGVDSFFHLWINHHYIGYSSDSRLSADFNITSYLLSCPHENHENNKTEEQKKADSIIITIEVLVLRYSVGTYVEDQDMYNLSGIFRDVLVYFIPNHIFIMDFNWNSSYNMNNRQGTLDLSILIKQKLDYKINNDNIIRKNRLNRKYAIYIVLYEEGLLLHTNSYSNQNTSNNPLPSQFIFENSHINRPICSTIKPISSAQSVVGKDSMKNKDLYLRDWQSQHQLEQQTEYLQQEEEEEGELNKGRGRNSRMQEEHVHRNNQNSNSSSSSSSSSKNLDGQEADGLEQEKEVMDDHISRIDCSLTIPSSQCNLWCAEKPYIYTLVISLLDVTDCTDEDLQDNRDDLTIPPPSSAVLQCESSYVGIRTIHTTAAGILTLNNRSVTIRGVNLHEHDPILGHTITPQLAELDVVLLKRHNFNAVRTSHYPHTPWFYQLCTVYGLYVIDECNIETHGMQPSVGRLAEDPDWASAYLLRLSRMYYRDKTHTCVIGWSLGNESGYTALHNMMYVWLKSRDSSRFVMYEPASYGSVSSSSGSHNVTGLDNPHDRHFNEDNSSGEYEEVTLINMIRNWFTSIVTTSITTTDTTTGTTSSSTNSKALNTSSKHNNHTNKNNMNYNIKTLQDTDIMATDILCPMYARTEECIRLSHLYPSLPLIQCEYAHMMGNSGGNLSKDWTLYWDKSDHPRIQGGFIWDWVDQGLTVQDSSGRAKWVYGGDFGEVSHDSNFCINGLVWPDRGIDLRNIYSNSAILTDTNLSTRDSTNTNKYGIDFHTTTPVLGYGKSDMTYVGLGGVRTTPTASSSSAIASLSTITIQQKLLNRKGSHNTLVLPLHSPTTQQRQTNVLQTVLNIVAKPSLLEAKQCMTCFHFRVLSVHNEDGDDDDDSIPALSTTTTPPQSTTAHNRTIQIRSRKNSRVLSRHHSSSIRRTPPNNNNTTSNNYTTTHTTTTTATTMPSSSTQPLTPLRQHSDERPRSGIQYLANLHEGPRMHDSIVTSKNKAKNPIESPIQLQQHTTTHNNISSSSMNNNSNNNSNNNDDNNRNIQYNSNSNNTWNTSSKDCFFDSPVCTTDEIYIENISESGFSTSNSDNDETEFQHMPYDRLNGRAILSISLEIENRYDHIDDIFEYLDFHALLLCDGVIVAEEIVLSSVLRLNDTRARSRSDSFKYITTAISGNRVQKAQVEFDLNWLNLHSTLYQGGSLNDLFSHHTYSGKNIDSIWSVDSSSSSSSNSSSTELHNEAVICGLPWYPSLLHCTNDFDAIHMNVRTIQEYYLQQVRSRSVHHTTGTTTMEQYNTTMTGSIGINHTSKHTAPVGCPGWTILRSEKPKKHQTTTLHTPASFRDSSSTTSTPLNTSSLHKNTSVANNQWSIVIIGIMNTTTAYAETGYPVGFSTTDITAECNAILSTEIHAAEQSMSRVNSRTGFKSPSPTATTTDMSTTTIPTTTTTTDCSTHLHQQQLPAVRWIESKDSTACCDVQLSQGALTVVIDSSRGTLKSFRVNNFDYLHSNNTSTTTSSGVPETPCRMQLHRAPTDNDRNGYLALWESCGLDCDMTVQRHPSLISTPIPMPTVGDGLVLNEEYCPDGVTICHNHPNTETEDAAGMSLLCTWSMIPTKPVNRMKLYLMQIFQQFLHDHHRKEMFLQFQTLEERDWIFHLGMMYRLGRHLQYVRSLPEMMFGTMITPGSVESVLAVYIWKPWVYINSTIPCAEELIGGGFGIVKQPEASAPVKCVAHSDLMLSYIQSRNLPNPEAETPIEVFYEALYTLHPSGVLSMKVTVDTTAFIVPLPRVGLQFNLPLTLNQVRWRGCGPQECYPDRQTSTINAVHSADLRTEHLHVPYVRPGENGSRTEVHWVQFSTTPNAASPKNKGSGPALSNNTSCSSNNIPSNSNKPRTMRITSNHNFNFSSQRYTTEELTSATHINDILPYPRNFYAINLDSYLMGLGGDDSWSACVQPEFTLTGKTYQYEFKFYAE